VKSAGTPRTYRQWAAAASGSDPPTGLHSDAEGAWVAQVDRAAAGTLVAVLAASAAPLVRFVVVGSGPGPVV